jgi:FkbM family methyltransferase
MQKIVNLIKRIVKKFGKEKFKRSYSLKSYGIKDIVYLDIGAYHPIELSNTYFFYENGHHGLCIEPNKKLFIDFKAKRPQDIVLNIGIGIDNIINTPFYIMNPATLSTFSKKEMEKIIKLDKNTKLESIQNIELKNVNDIIREYLKRTPDFISLDVEGLDSLILKSFDFKRFRPRIFCVETISYSLRNSGKKDQEIFNIMNYNGYIVYADTYINTIFIDSQK